jgi:SecD/SecF fusion protein
VSLFTALVLTRLLVDLAVRSPGIAARPGLLGLRVGGRFRAWVEHRPNLLRHSWRWLALSGIAIVVAVTGLVTRGLDYGLEFSGGRLVEYDTARPAGLDRVRAEVADAGFAQAVVQESGDGDVAIRTQQLTDAEAERVRAAVASVTGDAQVVRDEFVGPTIGAELRRKAVIALALALAAQLVYLAVRFRWTYGAAAVTAMFHDVTLVLGVFAWLGKTVDGIFLAALLTVIGYSINDSVVVFDRIRELRRARPRDRLVEVASDACLQTVPRTLNTGLGALFILLALYFLGGETLTDFALALLVGILVGTYSSVFTATPLAVLFQGRDAEPAGTRAPLTPRARVPARGPAEERAAAPVGARPADPPSRPRSSSGPRPRKRKKGKRR